MWPLPRFGDGNLCVVSWLASITLSRRLRTSCSPTPLSSSQAAAYRRRARLQRWRSYTKVGSKWLYGLDLNILDFSTSSWSDMSKLGRGWSKSDEAVPEWVGHSA